jgi:hypothetical protein
MQCGALRTPSAAAARPAVPRPACGERRLVRAAVSAEKPANVTDAEEWVARWREKQADDATPRWKKDGNGKGSDEDEPAANGKANGKLSPCKSLPDGTLLFTADSLKKVSFNDVKL